MHRLCGGSSLLLSLKIIAAYLGIYKPFKICYYMIIEMQFYYCKVLKRRYTYTVSYIKEGTEKMGKKDDKTNVMRILDQKKLNYSHYTYDMTKLNAVEVANELGQDPAGVFKTLVTVGRTKEYYVFMVPAMAELDLKKAAMAAGEKSVEMLLQKELLGLTGYIHGGCSPIGMKKFFKTFIDQTAENFDAIFFSAGRVGYQVRMALGELQKVIPVKLADIIKEL